MSSRKHPKLLSDRQIRRKVSAQKALFHKEVQSRLLEFRKSHETVNNIQNKAVKTGLDDSSNIVGQSLSKSKSYFEKSHVYFDCLLKHLCNYENSTTPSDNIQINLAQNESENPQEAVDEILNEAIESGDVGFNFFEIIQQLLNMDDKEETEIDEEISDEVFYLDQIMLLSEKNDPNLIFINNIRKLCIKYIHTIPHTYINELLIELRQQTGLPFPKDARTFLKTPRKCQTYRMGTGEYCHYGVKEALISFLTAYDKKSIDSDCIRLIVNMDGARMDNSSEDGLWIITVSETILNLVELVGIHKGKHKPKDSDDLVRKFVDEITFFINNGITFQDKSYQVILHCLVCDAPAKAYILKVKLFSGYWSCSKCTIKGAYTNKVFFPSRKLIGTKLRTDEEFLNQQYDPKNLNNGVEFDEFQQGETIMKDIPNFKPITDVVLDYMHLILLGVLVKLIELWIQNPKVVMSEYERKKVSDKLASFKDFITSDFSRNPREFCNVRRLWKAHELRTFLLYTGPIVLYNILPPHLYLNFLLLHVAISILVNPALCKSTYYLNYAEQLLILFVKSYEQYYGEENMVFNIHNCLHLVNDVRRFGPLDNFSAFRFENHIRKIKLLLRKGDKKLQQIAYRLGEIRASKAYDDEDDIEETNFLTLPKMKSFEVVKKNSIKIDCRNEKDKYVLLEDGSYLDCSFFMKSEDGTILVVGRSFKSIENFYEYPLPSSTLNINVIESTNVEKPLEIFLYQSIKAKVCKLPLLDRFVAIPLIHTYGNFEY